MSFHMTEKVQNKESYEDYLTEEVQNKESYEVLFDRGSAK